MLQHIEQNLEQALLRLDGLVFVYVAVLKDKVVHDPLGHFDRGCASEHTHDALLGKGD
jgi:hypothetical protein